LGEVGRNGAAGVIFFRRCGRVIAANESRHP
jgi:hypothetical protein